jgi:hypothetical protein
VFVPALAAWPAAQPRPAPPAMLRWCHAHPKIPWASGWRRALPESEVAASSTLEATMPEDAPRLTRAAIRTDLGAIFVSLELSRRAWLITSLSPGGGEKMSKHSVPGSDVSGLLRRFAELRRKAAARTWPGLPDYRHPGDWSGRLLDPSGAAVGGDREPRC